MNAILEPMVLTDFTNQWGRLLIDLTLKGSLLLALVGLTCTIMRRAAASVKHLLWTLAIAAVVLLPLLTTGLPSWRVKALPDFVPSSLYRGYAVPSEDLPTRDARLHRETLPGTDKFHAGTGDVSSNSNTKTPGEAEQQEKVVTKTSASQEKTIMEDQISAPTSAASQIDAGRRDSLSTYSTSRSAVVAFFIWIAGILVVLGVFLVGSIRLTSLVRKATLLDKGDWAEEAGMLAVGLGFRGAVKILRSSQLVTPMSWGLWRGVILLPHNCDEWSQDQRRDVLVHEISHLKRRDCFTQSLANIACVLYWFNPLVWYAGGRMRAERERSCDDQVLMAGSKPSTYADNLLEIAVSLASEHRSSYVSVAMARRSQISGRLMAVLDPKTRRRAPGRMIVLAASLLIAAMALPLAALSPGETSMSLPAADVLASDAKEAGLEFSTDHTASVGKSNVVHPKIRAAIMEANRLFDHTLKQGDASAMADLFTRDAQMYSFMRPAIMGREQIRAHCQNLINEGAGGMKLESEEFYWLDEMVQEIGRFTLVNDNGMVMVRGHYMTVWKKEDGRWKVYRDISSI